MVTAAEREVADILARADRQDATDEALEDQALRLAGRLDGLAAFLEGEEDQKRWSRLAGLLREAVTASPKDVWSVRSDAKAALKRAASFTGSAIVEPERLQPALIRTSPSGLKTFEIFAGAGGLAEGFRQAGFAHVGLAEWNADACATLRANFRGVTVHEGDVARLLDADLPRVDVLAGGPPCQPFSIGSNSQGGEFDDRNKFPISLELVKHIRPRAVVFENVSGIFTEKNARFRTDLVDGLERAGYAVTWEELDAQDYGVPQRRKRSFLVAFSDPGLLANFRWPAPRGGCCTVAKTLEPLLRECGWTPPPGFLEGLQTVAPTIVGGSDLKDGVDLGHKMVRKWWANRGVVATRFAAKAPGPDHMGPVVPTLAMLAALQGFPPDWIWCGSRLEVFRQIGNAVCPPLGATIAAAVRLALTGEESTPPFILRPFGGVMAYMAAKYGHEAIWAAEQEERDLAWRIPAE